MGQLRKDLSANSEFLSSTHGTSNPTTSDPYTAISTFNYTTQRDIVIKRKGAKSREIGVFRHGQTQYIEERWLGWLLDKFLSNSSPDRASTEACNTIPVGHYIGGDLGILTNPKGGKFEFSLQKFPNVLVLDTQIIAQRWFGASRKLKHILKELQFPFWENDLHRAGNDACFTLQVLLMLAIYEDVKIGNELQLRSKF
jgi:hypothetical protein